MPTSPVKPFLDGDRVTFIGDSTTHASLWHRHVREFYATRRPDIKVRFTNCGVSGDSAEGAVARFADDILPTHPTTAVVMFGMNDVWRHLYDPDSPQDEATMSQKTEAIDRYDAAMRKLVVLLQESGCARITLMTPSPFDDEVQSPQTNLPGVNAALATCSRRAAAIAHECGVGFIDIHTPMNRIGQAMRQADPTRTLNRIDRVHPSEIGMRVKGELFLQAQGIESYDSHVTIESATGTVAQSDNATVLDVAAGADELTFTMTTAAMPLPMDDTADAAFALLPSRPPLCIDTLKVTSLPNGTYSVYEDDELIATCSQAALDTRVDLSRITNSARMAQAQDVCALIEANRALQCLFRDMRFTEYKLLTREGLDISDPAIVKAEMDVFLSGMRGRGEDPSYFEHVYEGFRRIYPIQAETLAEIALGQDAIIAAQQPRQHRYRIVQAD